MYKKILVPLDGSTRAEAILPHVEDVADRFDAKIILLKVADPPFILVNPYDPLPQKHEADYQQYLQDIELYLTRLETRFSEKGITVEKLVKEGPVVNTIIETAVHENVDLIAMASHGRTGLSRVFYGSVAAGVLHQVDRPLLLIRASGVS
jgi:nucleotide-binding universal stress UspA family protein